ncbi:MAG: HXXEE domain-containing protein [Lachnospiraceae bacterium]|nr:HXXEE domain-containing protein [Lachnospiraceae bacterium]
MKKYNLEMLTLIMFGMVSCCAVFYNQLSLIQRIMIGYMFLFTLHEWEETRFPGGFAKLMSKFFGLEVTQDKENASHIPVVVLLIVITFIPFFTQSPFLALVPVYLGLFETFIHIVGIKIHKMKKPYTPGLASALLLCAASVSALTIFFKNQLVQSTGYAWGVLLMFLCFALMQRTVIAIFGLGYKDLIANIKKKIKGN